MNIVRHEVIDWEPLTLTLVAHELNADDVDAFTRRWIARRPSMSICNCVQKSLSFESIQDGRCIRVAVQWMCEQCLANYCRQLETQYPNLQEMRIGLNPSEVDKSNPVPSTGPFPAFIVVAEKEVELEDSRRILVPEFAIARKAVSTEEFQEFVNATHYVTTAEEYGLEDTFNRHGAMSPIEPERLTGAVTCVSFYDALKYCTWKRGARLPTEPEWLAAAIVDDGIYDEWADRELINDDSGRLRHMFLPTALEQLGCEWTSTDCGKDRAVIRCGPQWIRFTDWRESASTNRRVTHKDETSMFVGFRVVLTK